MMDKPRKKLPKPPVVRQTKSSIYRLAKTNPLLVRENQIQVANKSVHLPEAVVHGRLTLDEIQFRRWTQSAAYNLHQTGKLSLGSGLLNHGDVSKPSQPFSANAQTLESKPTFVKVTSSNSLPAKQNVALQSKVSDKKPKQMTNNILKPSNTTAKQKPTELQKSQPTTVIKAKVEGARQVSYVASKNVLDAKIDKFKMPAATAHRSNTVRRSISAEHFVQNNKAAKRCTSSMMSDSSSSLETFGKFMNYRNNIGSNSSTPYKPSKPETTLNKLQLPLKEWLSGRNKSLSNYQHLKCFGMQQINQKDVKLDDKENTDSNCENEVIVNAEPEKDTSVNENIVTGAIEDLHNLIVIGYPLQQCEAWLDYIKMKHKKIVNLPQYWECRAAIEQSRGDITRAIECYQNSIINGANIDQIDESLGQLLSKFSLLNIHSSNTPNIKKYNTSDGSNLFKSTIIQFAIKERSLNMNDKDKKSDEGQKRFTVTPVRRSTRKSGMFKNTPGKILYDSLNDVDSTIKENLEFKNNAFLE